MEQQIMDELGAAVRRLNNTIESIESRRQPAQAASAVIHVNAGGLGVWLAVTCCLVMMSGLMVGALWFASYSAAKRADDIEQNRVISDLQAYLQAIYVAAPDLKPKKDDAK